MNGFSSYPDMKCISIITVNVYFESNSLQVHRIEQDFSWYSSLTTFTPSSAALEEHHWVTSLLTTHKSSSFCASSVTLISTSHSSASLLRVEELCPWQLMVTSVTPHVWEHWFAIDVSMKSLICCRRDCWAWTLMQSAGRGVASELPGTSTPREWSLAVDRTRLLLCYARCPKTEP